MLEEKPMSGEERVSSGGRTPLEIPPGRKYRVCLRGAGVYKTVDAKNFETGETMEGVKLESAGLIVCAPEDISEVYIVSGVIAPRPTTYGKSILALMQKHDNVYWLKADYANAIGWIGKVTQASRKGYNRMMEFLSWDHEVDKKGNPVYLETDEPMETVGADQRMQLEGASESTSEVVI